MVDKISQIDNNICNIYSGCKQGKMDADSVNGTNIRIFSRANNRTDGNDVATEDPLDYYHSLCEEFPGVTFRLGDIAQEMKHTSMLYLGYDGSFNQVGDAFGYPGHTSINIDVSVIRKMQSDPMYELKVKDKIKSNCELNGADAQRNANLGMPYIFYNIQEDNNGNLMTGCVCGALPPITEEEANTQWDKKNSGLDFENIKLSLGVNDVFFEMLDKSIEKTREEAEKREEERQHDDLLDKYVKTTQDAITSYEASFVTE